MGPHPSSHFDSYRPKFSVRCSCAPENRDLDISDSGWFETFETSLSGEFFTVVDQPQISITDVSLLPFLSRLSLHDLIGRNRQKWSFKDRRMSSSHMNWANQMAVVYDWDLIHDPWEPLGYQDTTKVGVVNTVYSRYDLVLWYRL